jgi:hypothetical protein
MVVNRLSPAQTLRGNEELSGRTGGQNYHLSTIRYLGTRSLPGLRFREL